MKKTLSYFLIVVCAAFVSGEAFGQEYRDNRDRRDWRPYAPRYGDRYRHDDRRYSPPPTRRGYRDDRRPTRDFRYSRPRWDDDRRPRMERRDDRRPRMEHRDEMRGDEVANKIADATRRMNTIFHFYAVSRAVVENYADVPAVKKKDEKSWNYSRWRIWYAVAAVAVLHKLRDYYLAKHPEAERMLDHAAFAFDLREIKREVDFKNPKQAVEKLTTYMSDKIMEVTKMTTEICNALQKEEAYKAAHKDIEKLKGDMAGIANSLKTLGGRDFYKLVEGDTPDKNPVRSGEWKK